MMLKTLKQLTYIRIHALLFFGNTTIFKIYTQTGKYYIVDYEISILIESQKYIETKQ